MAAAAATLTFALPAAAGQWEDIWVVQAGVVGPAAVGHRRGVHGHCGVDCKRAGGRGRAGARRSRRVAPAQDGAGRGDKRVALEGKGLTCEGQQQAPENHLQVQQGGHEAPLACLKRAPCSERGQPSAPAPGSRQAADAAASSVCVRADADAACRGRNQLAAAAPRRPSTVSTPSLIAARPKVANRL